MTQIEKRELIDYFDKKFDHVDKRFEKIEKEITSKTKDNETRITQNEKDIIIVKSAIDKMKALQEKDEKEENKTNKLKLNWQAVLFFIIMAIFTAASFTVSLIGVLP